MTWSCTAMPSGVAILMIALVIWMITDFKAYLERQVATNRDFVERLLRAKDFQEAFRIQVEHFQSQLKAAAEDASKIGAKMASAFNRAKS